MCQKHSHLGFAQESNIEAATADGQGHSMLCLVSCFLKNTFLASIALLIAYNVLRQISSYLKLSFYRKQGIKTYYYPIIGFLKLMKPIVDKEDLQKSQIDEKEEILAFNNFRNTEPSVFLKGSELLSEFFLKETTNFERVPVIGEREDVHSFFFDFSEKGNRIRSLFTDFFRTDNINKILPKIEEIFANRLDEFRNKTWSQEELEALKRDQKQSSDKLWRRIKLAPVLKEAFDEMVNVILFGCVSSAKKGDNTPQDKLPDIPTIDGKLFSVYTQDFLLQSIKAMRNPFNVLTGYFFLKHRLLKEGRNVERMRMRLEIATNDFYEARKAQAEETGFGVNIIDLMIQLNQRLEEEGRLDEVMDARTIADNARIFYLAGYDTSKTNSSIAILNLAGNPSLQDRLRTEFRDLQRGHDDHILNFQASDYVENFLKENLRRYGPAVQSLPRVCTKTCKLGKYTIRKGTRVQLEFGRVHMDENQYEAPFEFDAERFKEGKFGAARRQHKYLPFSAGKRACLGQYLGECLVKIVIKTVIERFEVRTCEGGSRPSLRQGIILSAGEVELEACPLL